MTDKKIDKSAPMDPGAREADTITITNNTRVCWAIKTLVAEFHSLFPETPVEYSNYDGRNTALDVTFDLTTLGDEDSGTAMALLTLLGDSAHNTDARIAGVIEEDDAVLVSITPGPRTQDSRQPFGLDDAYMVLIGEDN